jgi:hypothetical protein
MAAEQGLGGKATHAKYGSAYMSMIGRRGREAAVRAGHGDVAFRGATNWRRENPSRHMRRVMDWLDANGFSGFEIEHVICYDGYNLAIDLAFPEDGVGIEVHGEHHYRPAFGMTREEWLARLEREVYRLSLKRVAGWEIYELDGRAPDWNGLEAWLKERLWARR